MERIRGARYADETLACLIHLLKQDIKYRENEERKSQLNPHALPLGLGSYCIAMSWVWSRGN